VLRGVALLKQTGRSLQAELKRNNVNQKKISGIGKTNIFLINCIWKLKAALNLKQNSKWEKNMHF
jgi:hypothetical protein